MVCFVITGNLGACGIKGQVYESIHNLLALQAMSHQVSPPLPAWCCRAFSPLRGAHWKESLSSHPDSQFAQYILTGIEQGFRIGADRSRGAVQSANRNMPSAYDHPDIVSEYLHSEVASQRMFSGQEPTVQDVHRSPMGIIPKPHQPGRWRLITNLSAPVGRSVNDLIPPHLCSPSYPRLDDVATIVAKFGKGTLLAKLDLEAAYRIIPVNPMDRDLLAVRWEGSVFVDGALPFGLRSTPIIFNAVADALLWIMFQRGLTCGLHYLDDFLLAGPPGSSSCAKSLSVALDTCDLLGVPVAAHKTIEPSTSLTFLGIQVDTVEGQFRLPVEKLSRLKATISAWRGRRKCTKRELLSLVGQLQHAASVVKPGRTFLRRMIDLSKVVSQLHFTIRLNNAFRADLEWWHLFISRWNGTSLIQTLSAGARPADVTVFSDASNWGCGACSSRHWFQTRWPPMWEPVAIAIKELLAVVLAAATWGPGWHCAHVLFRCDNEGVVYALKSGTSRHPHMMHLLRAMHFISAHFQFSYVAAHIEGSANVIADSLSRQPVSASFLLSFQADRDPSPFPEELVRLLSRQEAHVVDWLTLNWTQLFASSIGRA